MEPITGIEKVSKQRWKLVRFLQYLFVECRGSFHSRNAVFATIEVVPVFNVRRRHVLRRSTLHVLGRKSFSCR